MALWQYPPKLKAVNNHSYIHGDLDNDGVVNIDDKRPFDHEVKDRVNKEVSLSELFNFIEERRSEATKIATPLAKEYGAKMRVKDAYSTLNKAIRRNPQITNDFIGFRVETEKRAEAVSRWTSFNAKNNIKDVENKYVTYKDTTNLYRALHSNFTIKGFGAEMQYRTREYGKLNDVMHKDYKKNLVNPELQKVFKKKSKKLLDLGF